MLNNLNPKKILSHSLAKNSAIVFTGSMVANISAYLYHLFVGRILGPVQYGELAALLSLFYLINIPSSVMQTVLVKFFSIFKAQNNLNGAKYFFLEITKKITYLVVIGIGFIYLLSPYLSDFLHITERSYFIWLFLIFAFFFISTVNLSVLQGFQKFGSLAFFANAGMVLRLITGIFLAYFGVGWTLIGNVISNLASYLLMFSPIQFLLNAQKEPSHLSLKNTAYYSVPVFLSTLSTTALYSQDVILVKHFFPSDLAGIYSSLSVLGKIIFFASSSVGAVMFPVIAERQELKKDYNKLILIALGLVSFISLGISVVYFLIPNFVVHLLFGSAYSSASQYLGFFGVFMMFYSLAYLLNNVELALGNTKVWLITTSSAVFQILFISLFHRNIQSIVYINVAISVFLFVSLFTYYTYARKKN